MSATEHEHREVVTLRRTPAGPGNGNHGGDAFEVICRICGDDPALDHQQVPAELQQIRGPYTLCAGITAFITHNEFHDGTDDM